jgi:hypothetical protein
MVSKQDIVTILFTFLCGVVAGTYLFVVGFMPQVSDVASSLPINNDGDKNFSVEGYEYGICEFDESCQSYNVLANGTYTFISSSFPTENNMFYGVINKGEWSTLKKILSSTTLEPLANENDSFRCLQANADRYYRYVIRADGVFYVFDTCNDRFSRASALYSGLGSVWELIRPEE